MGIVPVLWQRFGDLSNRSLGPFDSNGSWAFERQRVSCWSFQTSCGTTSITVSVLRRRVQQQMSLSVFTRRVEQ